MMRASPAGRFPPVVHVVRRVRASTSTDNVAFGRDNTSPQLSAAIAQKACGLANLAAVDDHVVFVGSPVDADCAEGKLFEAHTHLRRIVYLLVMIEHISAVTLAVKDVARSVAFYEKIGFEVVYGGDRSAFTTLRSGAALLNLTATPGYDGRWWGRVIFRVDDADAQFVRLVKAGVKPEAPRDASWGER